MSDSIAVGVCQHWRRRMDRDMSACVYSCCTLRGPPTALPQERGLTKGAEMQQDLFVSRMAALANCAGQEPDRLSQDAWHRVSVKLLLNDVRVVFARHTQLIL